MSSLSYYAQLARRMSPGELAGLAARRAYRAARVAFSRPEPLAARDVLRAHGAQTPAELVRVALGDAPDFWADLRRRESVLRALEAVPGARDRVLARAERLAAGRHEVFGASVMFGARGVDWALDPVTGGRFADVPADELPLVQPGMDPKYPWELGRLSSAVALVQGAWVAPEGERFAHAAVDLMLDFVRSNPQGRGVQWACPMEVALRAANLGIALRMLGPSPSLAGEELLELLCSLGEHLAWVEAHLEDAGAVPNNHLLANHVGLLVAAAAFPRVPGARGRRASAIAGLRAEARRQVLVDGWSFEGSVPYHRLAVELLTLAWVSDGEAELGEPFRETLRQMFHAASGYCSERGLAPQWGDNDSGRALPFTERPSLEHGYLVPLGAGLLGDASLKRAGAAPCEELAWLLGEAGISRYQGLRAAGGPAAFSSPASSLHVLQGGGAFVAVSAGPVGQHGAGGHSHNDQLSFELHVDGAPVLVDPGSPTYGRNALQRNAYRGTGMHNTWSVDGAEQSPLDPDRLFALADRARGRLELFATSPERDELVASHRGFGEPPSGVRVRRALSLDKAARVLSVEDVLEGEGRHQAALPLHFPSAQVRLRPVTGLELARIPPWGAMGARLPGARAVEHGGCVLVFEPGPRLALEAFEYSPGYGQLTPAVRAVARWAGELPVSVRWWVLF